MGRLAGRTVVMHCQEGQDHRGAMKSRDKIVQPDHHSERTELFNRQGAAEDRQSEDIRQAGCSLIKHRIETGHRQPANPPLDRRKDAARKWLPRCRAGHKTHLERRLRH